MWGHLTLKRSIGIGSIVLDLIGEPLIRSRTSFSLRTVNSVREEVARGSGNRVWLVVTHGCEGSDCWIFSTLSLKNVTKSLARFVGESWEVRTGMEFL